MSSPRALLMPQSIESALSKGLRCKAKTIRCAGLCTTVRATRSIRAGRANLLILQTPHILVRVP
ncbi:hypothetical protein CC77DRAFT_1015719 [Alternaria alternata]|uniref:Uncharacterized protein n=1 Tax=Alternaria alternata TaxID=5599 RepID=A0A177E392_ALTAL|nr:hypothetical protein CC77DRAFT_1015719 [Alternaria alternata]OAG26425.1 hypothetical protein CC77DRAFT_1015719 [Alternaria alternata]